MLPCSFDKNPSIETFYWSSVFSAHRAERSESEKSFYFVAAAAAVCSRRYGRDIMIIIIIILFLGRCAMPCIHRASINVRFDGPRMSTNATAAAGGMRKKI